MILAALSPSQHPAPEPTCNHPPRATLLLCGSLAIKGNPNEEAVLCTTSRTYLLRLAESSNTLLLMPGQLPKAPPAEGPPADIAISSSASAYFELVPTAPRASALPEL